MPTLPELAFTTCMVYKLIYTDDVMLQMTDDTKQAEELVTTVIAMGQWVFWACVAQNNFFFISLSFQAKTTTESLSA